ncbi:unnamed protein product [Cylicostephanus goldi]|uniref:tRNA-intron lyase n=1 Tax=Cylicostephanus goldi TaxID=71465 RepID=A0A3P6RDQ4_CYLGO|nr:unnamed protein product [Cylicostephanus goldi]
MFHWLDQYDIPLPCTRQFRARELVYHDLWRKGYYLTCGDQFGSAWLVYEGLPGNVHAKFLCDFILDDEMLSPLKLISLVRVATQVGTLCSTEVKLPMLLQVKKTLLIAIVPSDNNLPHYITFEWFKPYTRDVE